MDLSTVRRYRVITSLIVLLCASSVGLAQTVKGWSPDTDRYGHFRNTYTTENNEAWVYATTQRDAERMASMVELFPPYMFDYRTHYIPGTGGEGQRFGYIVLVDQGSVTFVMAERRANEIAGSRFLAFVLIRELVGMWQAHGEYRGVSVSLAYVPAFRDPLVFAIGITTEIGVKVVMGE